MVSTSQIQVKLAASLARPDTTASMTPHLLKVPQIRHRARKASTALKELLGMDAILADSAHMELTLLEMSQILSWV